MDLTNCCEQVSSRVASDRLVLLSVAQDRSPASTRLEAAEFDSPMGRP